MSYVKYRYYPHHVCFLNLYFCCIYFWLNPTLSFILIPYWIGFEQHIFNGFCIEFKCVMSYVKYGYCLHHVWFWNLTFQQQPYGVLVMEYWFQLCYILLKLTLSLLLRSLGSRISLSYIHLLLKPVFYESFYSSWCMGAVSMKRWLLPV